MENTHLNLAGVPMRNRLIVAAGCHGADGDTIVRTSREGVAAVTTKTIVAQAVEDVRPCFSVVEGGFLNCVFGTTLPASQWFEHELPRVRRSRRTLHLGSQCLDQLFGDEVVAELVEVANDE